VKNAKNSSKSPRPSNGRLLIASAKDILAYERGEIEAAVIEALRA